jgi:hypothetical protein
MSNTTNIDKLVYDYLLSTYVFKKSSNGHDLLFRNTEHINGMELITELKLIFNYDSLKSFILISEWGHKQNRILFEFWRQNRYRIDLLPDYMKMVINEYNYEELYQDFYFDKLDT